VNQPGFAPFVAHLASALSAADVPYMLVGSVASGIHGEARATRDIDVVVRLSRSKVPELARLFPADDFYFDEDMAREAIARGSQFNVIDGRFGWKADLIVARGEFANVEFRRRVKVTLEGTELYVASAEDTILSKLGWAKAQGTSNRQLEDCAGILRIKGPTLDMAYLAEWVRLLAVEAQWAELDRMMA
jgi:hypothetical protein